MDNQSLSTSSKYLDASESDADELECHGLTEHWWRHLETGSNKNLSQRVKIYPFVIILILYYILHC